MELEQGFDVNEIKRMVRRRAGLVLGTTLLVFLVAVFVAAILPNEYESYATLLVEPQTISERLVESGLARSDANSRLHLIQMQILSRGRLSRVIDDLGLYAEESKEMTREEIIDMMRRQVRLVPVLPDLPEEVMALQRSIEVNTFQLFFRHHDAQTAATVANRLASDFVDEHIRERVEISGDTSEFIESELVRLAQRIAEVETRIAAVKSENARQLPEDVTSNQRLLERALDGARAAQRDLAIARSDEAFYRQQALAAEALSQDEATSPVHRLDMLQLELGQMRSRGLTEKHPDMIRMQAEIAALEEQVAAASEAEPDERPTSLAAQSARAEAERAALRAAAADHELQRLQTEATEIELRLAATPRVAEQLAALEREHRHLFGSYQEFSEKRLEASVAANMERRQKGEQFRVLEAAFPAPRPRSPNRPLVIAMGLLVGMALGGGLGVLLEAFDGSVRDARRLQESLQLPVLAQVPTVILASDRAASRRRRLRWAAASVVFSGLMLGASVAGHWAVNGMPGVVRSLVVGDEAAQPGAPAPGQG